MSFIGDRITYKCQLNSIDVVIHEESYTSKCDHLAFEPIEKQEKYLGKRVKRGLFRSSIKKVLNADVNGAIGILRKSKVVREWREFIQSIMDTGKAFLPYKINVL